jgi:hypothetical protein
VDLPAVVDALRGLCGRSVVSRLLDETGVESLRWEGVLAEEELDDEAVADRAERAPEERIDALRRRDVALFTVGGTPLLIDPTDIRDAQRVGDETIRLLVADGSAVEIAPA